jgi:hypothetical protein
MIRLAITALFFLLAYAAVAQTDTIVWTVQIGKTEAGYLKQFKNADGTFRNSSNLMTEVEEIAQSHITG